MAGLRGKPRVAAAGVVGLALLAVVSFPGGVRCGDRLSWAYEDIGRQIVRSIGTNDNKEAKEISGVVASRKKKDVLWTHNDSGSPPYIFALNATTGRHLAWFELNGKSIPNHDWEDIAIGPGPEPGVDYLYVGDVGSHQGEYKIVRFPEPKLTRDHRDDMTIEIFSKDDNVTTGAGEKGDQDQGDMPDTIDEVSSIDPYERIPIYDFEVIRFRYPQGKSHDCESITVDPISGDIFVVAKHSSRLDVYVLPNKPSLMVDSGVNELKLHYSSCNDVGRTGTDECQFCNGCVENIADFNTLVAADISPAGYGLIMSDYTHVFYWRREFLDETFFKYPPVQLPYSNTHGTEEALCWAADSKGYYIIPEGHSPELRYYPYADEAWWSEVRDISGSCYMFNHTAETEASCNLVPCSDLREVPVEFFHTQDSCESWLKLFGEMVETEDSKVVEAFSEAVTVKGGSLVSDEGETYVIPSESIEEITTLESVAYTQGMHPILSALTGAIIVLAIVV
mmetsp:Transcript_13918/g.35082  ORF Transcript_13918/g.35082 Transcript_13918/m.35082 type:complete len:507 (-) Transcript_13918:1572-3092(-)